MRDRRLFCRLAILAGIILMLTACQAAAPQGAARFECAPWAGNYVDGQGHTGLQGQIVLKESGAPLAGAFVNVYPDTISNLLGPSQFISSPSDERGAYRVEVPPGVYYVVARKRLSGQATGPLFYGLGLSGGIGIVPVLLLGAVCLTATGWICAAQLQRPALEPV